MKEKRIIELAAWLWVKPPVQLQPRLMQQYYSHFLWTRAPGDADHVHAPHGCKAHGKRKKMRRPMRLQILAMR
jgi:hypothetical protein